MALRATFANKLGGDKNSLRSTRKMARLLTFTSISNDFRLFRLIFSKFVLLSWLLWSLDPDSDKAQNAVGSMIWIRFVTLADQHHWFFQCFNNTYIFTRQRTAFVCNRIVKCHMWRSNPNEKYLRFLKTTTDKKLLVQVFAGVKTGVQICYNFFNGRIRIWVF